MTRDECIAESLGEGGIQCDTFQSVPFRATLCTTNLSNLEDQCHNALCLKANANPNASYEYPQPTCVVNSAILARNTPFVLPDKGTCMPTGAQSSRASVDYRLHSHSCVLGAGGVCTTIADHSKVSPAVPDNCIDLT